MISVGLNREKACTTLRKLLNSRQKTARSDRRRLLRYTVKNWLLYCSSSIKSWHRMMCRNSCEEDSYVLPSIEEGFGLVALKHGQWWCSSCFGRVRPLSQWENALVTLWGCQESHAANYPADKIVCFRELRSAAIATAPTATWNAAGAGCVESIASDIASKE